MKIGPAIGQLCYDNSIFLLSYILIKSFPAYPKLFRQLCPVCCCSSLLSQLPNPLCAFRAGFLPL